MVSILGISQFAVLLSLDFLLLVVSAAVYLFVRVGMIHGSYEKLLQTGDYAKEIKIANKKIAGVCLLYTS